MSWIEKDKSFSFEDQPPVGLFFLDGDVIAREVGADWTKGQKYPRIAFPSGLKFDLWEGRDSPIIHLFGELDLPLRSTRDEALAIAVDIGEQVGYFAARIGEDQLGLIGWEDYLVVTFDNDQRLMVNVEEVKELQTGAAQPAEQVPQPELLFPLGRVVATPGALRTLEEAGQAPSELLSRHVTGDWGDLDDQDKQENELSVKEGFRILSAYELANGEKVWLITEADRSATTILRPDEY